MAIRIGIDDFSGVGRQFFVVVQEGGFSDLFEIAEINDPGGAEFIADRLRNDETYGPFRTEFEIDDDHLTIGSSSVTITTHESVSRISAEKSEIDILVCCRGNSLERKDFDGLARRGAGKIVVPGECQHADFALVFGSSEIQYDVDSHNVLATGSPELQAIAPLVGAFRERFGVSRAHCSVVRPSSKDRPIVGGRARGGMNSLIPYHEAFQREIQDFEPLSDVKLTSATIEAPVFPVGWIAATMDAERRVAKSALVQALEEISQSEAHAGIVGLDSDRSVSVDHRGDPRSIVVDQSDVYDSDDGLMTVTGWYDAEWALACRTADTVALICEAGVPDTA